MSKTVDMLVGGIFCAAISTIILSIYLKYADPRPIYVGKPWFEIPREVEDKVRSHFVEVSTKRGRGSGCEFKPGYYVTALHVVTDAILDDTTISVNDQKAKEVWRSSTEEDYIILTTRAEFVKKRLDFQSFNNFGNNTNIIIVGSPGDQQELVQPGKILSTPIDGDRKAKKFARIISAQYIDFGLSGGCIYSEDGETLLGVVTNKYQNPGSTIGEATIVSDVNE